jgi:hypothetical protein
MSLFPLYSGKMRSDAGYPVVSPNEDVGLRRAHPGTPTTKGAEMIGFSVFALSPLRRGLNDANR